LSYGACRDAKSWVFKTYYLAECGWLHRKSGILPQNITELHGNTNIEKCIRCGKEYLRDYYASATYRVSVHDHRTGRICVVKGCGGELHDTIINFNENLDRGILTRAWEETEKSDLMLVLGSSLTVRPACDMPKFVGKNKFAKLVINNLQLTPLDDLSSFVVHGKCDEFLTLVMKYLELEIPPFTLRRRVVVEYKKEKNVLQVLGIDIDETPASIFYAVEIGETYLEAEPFFFDNLEGEEFNSDIVLYPMGHYKEQPFSINVTFNTSEDRQLLYECIYNLEFGWNVQNIPIEEKIEIIEVDYEAFNTTIDTSIDNTKMKNKENINNDDKSKWHSVVPREDCPHVEKFLKDSEGISVGLKTNKCNTCGDSTENWYCLTCGGVFCSRYVKGHGLAHYEETGHALLMSFSDLSTWCYKCEDYISDYQLSPALFLLHLSKFGVAHPHDHKNQFVSSFLCNICKQIITDTAYHCTECEDYDLCSTCHSKGTFNEPHNENHDLIIKKVKK